MELQIFPAHIFNYANHLLYFTFTVSLFPSFLLITDKPSGYPRLQLVEHFFQSIVNTSGMTLHIRQVLIHTTLVIISNSRLWVYLCIYNCKRNTLNVLDVLPWLFEVFQFLSHVACKIGMIFLFASCIEHMFQLEFSGAYAFSGWWLYFNFENLLTQYICIPWNTARWKKFPSYYWGNLQSFC